MDNVPVCSIGPRAPCTASDRRRHVQQPPTRRESHDFPRQCRDKVEALGFPSDCKDPHPTRDWRICDFCWSSDYFSVHSKNSFSEWERSAMERE